jgi:hypothetical protein
MSVLTGGTEIPKLRQLSAVSASAIGCSIRAKQLTD